MNYLSCSPRQLAGITMKEKEIAIAGYTYTLPDNRIALRPLEQRDSSKLLVYRNEQVTEDIYRNLSNHLPENSLLVFNSTRVVEARILFQKPTGGQIEIFCLEPSDRYPDISSAMLEKGKVYWNCLIGGASKWKPGQVLSFSFEEGVLEARFIARKTDCFEIAFSWLPQDLSFAEVLHKAGNIPLPPYIKRQVEAGDAERYQTIYARQDGSVAAPTAGLHFTDKIFKQLEEKNIRSLFLTLHVGAGTFRPVKSSTMGEHEMHAEFIDVPLKLLEELLHEPEHFCTAVGTTSLRTLESLYWLAWAIKRYQADPANGHFELDQWFSWENRDATLERKQALETLIEYMRKKELDRLVTKTRLLIMPGYSFRMVDALVTNFHQPQSTLLLLVAAFIGDQWRSIYDYALEHEFRFLSYGDGCLLFRKEGR